MDKFSQLNLKSPATKPEHAVRKAEFDQVIGDLESGKTAVVYALGLPSSSSDSFTQLADRIQKDKTKLATFLLSQNIDADPSESMSLLLSKLYLIPGCDITDWFFCCLFHYCHIIDAILKRFSKTLILLFRLVESLFNYER
jgi:hypothetical protein